MKTIPIWQDIKTQDYPSLDKDIETDILIIGGGITGINLLYALKDDKRKITLVEKNKIGMGVTSRSTAKITFLQQNIYTKLKKNFNFNTAYSFYKATKEAIAKMVTVIKKEKIECDLEKVDSYFYTLSKLNINEITEEQKILESFGEKVYEAEKLPNNIKVQKGIYVKDTYVFHPLKYVNKLAKISITDNHQIYENTNIYKIEKVDNYFTAYTNNNTIKCNDIVLSCHYPYFLLPFIFPLKCYIEKSYIMACKSQNLLFSAINEKYPIYSYRYYKDYLLTLSSSHNGSFNNNHADNFAKLFASNKDKIAYAWSNNDIMTLDNLPYIGLIKDNMYIATGYNTWGMTSSFIASLLLKDLLQKKYNHYETLFNPKRGITKDKILNMGVSIFSNSFSYLDSKINLRKSYYNCNPYFIKISNEKYGIYIDENKVKHIVKIKCPHLGCNLLFNKIEKTWECPCHGSVFDIDGNCILGPSNYNISVNSN